MLKILKEENGMNENIENQQAWDCVAHFLDSLYQDMLNGRKTGEQFPCNTCIHN